MYTPMSKMEEGWHEPADDLFDWVEQAENTLISRHTPTEWYSLNKPQQEPYNEEQQKIIRNHEKWSHLHSLGKLFCAWCGERLKPHINGRTVTCNHKCARMWENDKKRRYEEARRLRKKEQKAAKKAYQKEYDKLHRKKLNAKQAARRKKERQERLKNMVVHCLNCGTRVQITRIDMKYCGKKCREMFHNRQKQRKRWKEEVASMED